MLFFDRRKGNDRRSSKGRGQPENQGKIERRRDKDRRGKADRRTGKYHTLPESQRKTVDEILDKLENLLVPRLISSVHDFGNLTLKNKDALRQPWPEVLCS